jgi:hypothetical protein
VPLSAAPKGRADVVSTLLALFEQLHDQVRTEIEGLGDDGLNWTPGPGANSISTIVTHLVGSEAETLRCVAGLPHNRNRDDEFAPRQRGLIDLLGDLHAADELIKEVRPQIASSRLRARIALPTLPADERRSGLTWLVGNYGHAREHVGHIQLTRQLFDGTAP